MQSKLLVFLRKEFERLGSHRPVRVNVRVIAATNRDLEEMIKQQKFRGFILPLECPLPEDPAIKGKD